MGAFIVYTMEVVMMDVVVVRPSTIVPSLLQ